jgi:uncharacterized protein involved in exopolysaccharide biosynthesis
MDRKTLFDRKTLVALLIGLVVGATSAAALAPTPVHASDAQGTVWSADYAKFPHDKFPDEQPATF